MKIVLMILLHILAIFLVMHLVHIVIDSNQKYFITKALHVFVCLLFPLIMFMAFSILLINEKHSYTISLILYNVLNLIIIFTYPLIKHIGQL